MNNFLYTMISENYLFIFFISVIFCVIKAQSYIIIRDFSSVLEIFGICLEKGERKKCRKFLQSVLLAFVVLFLLLRGYHLSMLATREIHKCANGRHVTMIAK